MGMTTGASWPSLARLRRLLIGRLYKFDPQHGGPSAHRPNDLYAQSCVIDPVPRNRYLPKPVEDKPTDGVEPVANDVHSEGLVEFVDRHSGVYDEFPFTNPLDLWFFSIELVLDLTYDLLEQVFDRHDPRYPTVLVDDYCEVCALFPEHLEKTFEVSWTQE